MSAEKMLPLSIPIAYLPPVVINETKAAQVKYSHMTKDPARCAFVPPAYRFFCFARYDHAIYSYDQRRYG